MDVFARRLQVQERLTDRDRRRHHERASAHRRRRGDQAAHFCMMMRGVEKQNSRAITSALRGIFRDDSKTRDEFLRLAHGGRLPE